MTVLDAAYWTGRDYPGGIQALAARLGRPNLSDELNPNRPTAKLGLATAVDMQILADDFRILYAMAADCGHFPPQRMPVGLKGDGHQCMRTLSDMVKESADVVACTVQALVDNDVTDNELAQFDREASELIAVVQALRRQLAANNAALRARAPGEVYDGAWSCPLAGQARPGPARGRRG